jgi:hypothetical protein
MLDNHLHSDLESRLVFSLDRIDEGSFCISLRNKMKLKEAIFFPKDYSQDVKRESSRFNCLKCLIRVS